MTKFLSIFISASILIISACSNEKVDEKNPQVDSLTAMNRDLLKQLNERDILIKSFIDGFNEIQTNLEEVRNKQLSVKINSGKKGQIEKQEIMDNIAAIDMLMQKNKSTIKALKDQLKIASTENMAGYENFILSLETMITEKDKEIYSLLGNLDNVNDELGSMIKMYSEAKTEVKQKDKKLNTAWYTAGTTKELIKKGVISSEGGFIGIGKMKKLSENFNTENFSQVDISTLKLIKLEAQKVKLITTHVADSYSIVSTKEGSNLYIQNPEKFWSASKYLVVLIEKK
ncbi:MAG TPA: hypothetical protein PK323_07460 [Bacteroidia bacterium]|nr:hypothetical protein [Bacteroidia bacterium]